MKGRIYVPKDVRDEVKDTLTTCLVNRFDGFTVIEAKGGWLNDKNELIEEKTDLFEVVGVEDSSQIKELAQMVKAQSDEESVLWHTVRIEDSGLE